MKKLVTLVMVGVVAMFIGAGCKTTGGCCGKCMKGSPSAEACGSCAKSEVAKCAKCGMDKSACKCAAEAAK